MKNSVLPIIDLAPYLQKGPPTLQRKERKKLTRALHEYSAVLIKDPRVDERANSNYLDLMERYFGQAEAELRRDMRPDIFYQRGVSPPFSERPDIRQISAFAERVSRQRRPHVPPADWRGDVKWRFLRGLGPRPKNTRFSEMNPEEVIPPAFQSEWVPALDAWGGKLLTTLHTVSEMLAELFGLQSDTFTSLMHDAPHLIAPNGVDLRIYGRLGTIFNGWHWDLNLLTIHGKTRFPGLRIWLRDGQVMTVKIPDGCLLVQVGKQLEWLSGGSFVAGNHEVACLPETIRAKEEAIREGRPPIRVSSTVWAHVASDQKLCILPSFLDGLPEDKREKILKYYPTIYAGDEVTWALIVAGIIERGTEDSMQRLAEVGLV